MNRLLPVLAVPLLGVLAVVPLAHGLSVNTTYTYDAIGRLTKADYGTGQTFQYTFDKAGNLVLVAYSETRTAADARTEGAKDLPKAVPTVATETPLGAVPIFDENDLPPALRELLDMHTASAREVYATADGGRFLFETDASLLTEDTNGLSDLYLYDAQTNRIERISLAATGAQGNAPSTGGRLDGAGERVVFASEASNLVTDDTNGASDLFIRDLSSNTTERISLGLTGEQADGASRSARLDADGQWVVFVSEADNLIADDTNAVADVFRRDLTLGLTERISLDLWGHESSAPSGSPNLDDAATRIVYEQRDADGLSQVWLFDSRTGHSTPVIPADATTEAPWSLSAPALSAEGRYLAALRDRGTSTAIEIWVQDLATGRSTTLDWPDEADRETAEVQLADEGRLLLVPLATPAEDAAGAMAERWWSLSNPLAP